MAYRVPPKQILVYKGRTYGAGDNVPGYKPPRPSKRSKTRVEKVVEPEPEKAPEPDVEVNTQTGDE